MAARRPVGSSWPAAALAASLVLTTGAPALAQTRLYLLIGGDAGNACTPVRCDPGRLVEVDADAGRITATPITHARTRSFGPAVTADGRYLLWSGSELPVQSSGAFFSLYTLAARWQSPLFPVDDDVAYAPLFAHPSELRAWVQTGGGAPIVIEPGGARSLQAPPCVKPLLRSRSGDGRRLSYHCTDPRRLVVVDSADGHLVATVPLGAHPFEESQWTNHALDDTGETLYIAESSLGWELGNAVFKRVDVATGTVLAQRLGPSNVVLVWAFDPQAGRLYAGDREGLLVLDAATLADVGRVPTPNITDLPRLTFDPDRPYAYVAWRRDIPDAIRVAQIDTGTLATVASIELPVAGDIVGIALGPRPPRVSDLSIVVQNQVATLTWTLDASRSIAIEQLVEVGFAPGQTVATLAVAAGATTVTVPNVPPGRYYVRIRSVNGTGPGTPSNEVVVDVP